jgi:hypothetical protein
MSPINPCRSEEALQRRRIVELSLTAGFYAMVSRMLDAMRVELDPDVREHRAERMPGYRYDS